jgi:lysophospholipase L1-like esterase
VACLLGEVASRLVWRPLPPGDGRRPPARASLAGLPELRTVFQLATPNVRGVHKGLLYRTNSAGFRGPEYEEAKAPGTFRLVIVGDSFTMGSGVGEEQAYPALVEAKLNARGRLSHVEVLNLGLAGLNLALIVQRLETLGLRFHPDLIVYGFTVNDIEGPAYRASRAESVAAAQARWQRFAGSPSYLLRLLWPGWLSLTELVRARPGSYSYELEDNYFHNPDAWAGLAGGLDRLAAIGKTHGVCVHVLLHTVLHHLGSSHVLRPIYERVAGAASERGLTVTQSFPVFRGRDERTLVVGAYDLHPNAAGHRLLARALVAGLRGLPARCWRAATPPPERGKLSGSRP